MQNLKQILSELIAFESVSPEDKGCQEYMIKALTALGFDCERMDKPPVANFFARLGTKAPLLVFAGHTDVVAAGDEEKWNSNPFTLREEAGILYGRGVADMKGSLAAMLVMAEKFTQKYPHFKGSLGFLITSGEEGEDYDKGTPHVMQVLQERSIQIDYCMAAPFAYSIK